MKDVQRTRSCLAQWPCRIAMVPPHAPYLDGANLLVAADCSAFAYSNFHQEFMRKHITLIGCPHADKEELAEKLALILKENNIQSLKLIRLDTSCCNELEQAVTKAVRQSGKRIPRQVITISTDGKILD